MAANTYAPQAPKRQHPENWKSGPDWIDHQKYYAWLKHKAQAMYRDERYKLTWIHWQELWTNKNWEQRGRSIDSLCLTRIDPTKAWSLINCEIVSRQVQLARQGPLKRGRPRGSYKPK